MAGNLAAVHLQVAVAQIDGGALVRGTCAGAVDGTGLLTAAIAERHGFAAANHEGVAHACTDGVPIQAQVQIPGNRNVGSQIDITCQNYTAGGGEAVAFQLGSVHSCPVGMLTVDCVGRLCHCCICLCE